MDKVIAEARVRFHMHDLVARLAPGADEIDPIAVGRAPFRMVRVSIRTHLLASMRRIVATRRSNSTGL